MQKLTVNLDEYTKLPVKIRIFNLFLGALLIVISSITINNMVRSGSQFGDYLFFLILLLIGLHIIIYTLGFYRRVTTRYVEINDNGFEYKLSYFKTPRIINWSDIKRVEIRTLRIFFHTTAGSLYKMKLGEIYYRDIRSIKSTLASVCIEKKIRCIDKTTTSAKRLIPAARRQVN